MSKACKEVTLKQADRSNLYIDFKHSLIAHLTFVIYKGGASMTLISSTHNGSIRTREACRVHSKTYCKLSWTRFEKANNLVQKCVQ